VNVETVKNVSSREQQQPKRGGRRPGAGRPRGSVKVVNVAELPRLVFDGLSYRRMAARFGVSVRTLRRRMSEQGV